jgi:RNA polymerase sigma-70 factor (ECF subfamily)
MAMCCPLDAYRPRLRRTALRLVKNANDAEDIVQEAFLRWYAAPPRDAARPEAWLSTVVYRLSMDAHRLRKKEQLCDDAGLSRLAPSNTLNIDELDREADFAVVLHRLSERATADECVALLLREGFGYSYADIAAVLAKSEEACRQLVHRGKCAAQGSRAIRRRRPALSRFAVQTFLNALRHCDSSAALNFIKNVF